MAKTELARLGNAALWERVIALLAPDEPLRAEAMARAEAGEPVPGPVALFLTASTLDPNVIVRRKDSCAYLGVGPTSIDELVKDGTLPPPLTLRPGGIATGWLGITILSHQLKVLLRGCFGSELPADLRTRERLDGKAAMMRGRAAKMRRKRVA
jgi:predicted DNA-binding transcriptional regulator AlpA